MLNFSDLRTLAKRHGAIGFDYSTGPNGKIDWYQLRYSWQDGTPMQTVESVPITPLYEPEPIPEAIFTPKSITLETPLDLSNSPPFLIRWHAYTANIPTEMKKADRWCVWQKHEDGRKIPYRVLAGGQWSKSERAKSDTPATWTTFDEALFCFFNASGNLDGLSFALGDGYCGFDFDDVIVDGKIHPQAKSWLSQLGGYSEISQSGKGQKTILRGTLGSDFLGTAETGRQFKGIPDREMATEVYHCRRFFFLTGHGSGEPTENQQSIDSICSELLSRKAATQPKPKQRPRRHNTTQVSHLTDTAVLEKIRASKQAEKFDLLWNGQIGTYDSASEADMALTSLLMWWCNNDTAQVERLFEQSELAKREKWNREDYRDRTLAKVDRSDGYTPRPKSTRQSQALQRLAAHREKRQDVREVPA